LHHHILNVRTPPNDTRSRRGSAFNQRTYRKDFETPPLNGGHEPRTYFRENTVLLGDQKYNSRKIFFRLTLFRLDSNSFFVVYNLDDSLFANHLEREANERQINRLSMVGLTFD
jgi:hypothetical protein